MPDRIHILGLTGDELRAKIEALGMQPFRAKQVRQWAFERLTDDWAAMTNLSKADRVRLADALVIATGKVSARVQADDGVTKLLLTWPDGQTAESVMIPEAERRTACISSQIGCPVGCRFCASGLGGLNRNCTAGEIVEQVWQLARSIRQDAVADTEPAEQTSRLSNVVFMGIGEPLANYDAVVKAIRLINDPEGMNIGARKITVSTVGLPAQIRRLAREGLQVTLAISLHAPSQSLRAELVPWADKFPLTDVFDAARDYFAQTGREITLEYVLLDGVNTGLDQSDLLADLAHSVRCNVNLILCNPVSGLRFARPSRATADAFRQRLVHRGVNVHLRTSRGLTIDAACGQLRRELGARG